MIVKSILSGVLVFLLFSCVPKPQYDELQAQFTLVSSKLDSCKSNSPQAYSQFQMDMAKTHFDSLEINTQELVRDYPQLSDNDNVINLLVSIEKLKELEEMVRIITIQESDDRKIYHSTGIWTVIYDKDVFGNKLNRGYVRNEQMLAGQYDSQTAQNQQLFVVLKVYNPDKVNIVFYKFDKKTRARLFGSDHFDVMVQDANDNRHMLYGYNQNHDLAIDSQDALKLYTILKSGGRVLFNIVDPHSPKVRFRFTIPEAGNLESAISKLIQ